MRHPENFLEMLVASPHAEDFIPRWRSFLLLRGGRAVRLSLTGAEPVMCRSAIPGPALTFQQAAEASAGSPLKGT